METKAKRFYANFIRKLISIIDEKYHGNSHKNMDDHHLYDIWDNEKEDIFKLGISGDALKEDGSSSRANNQTKFLNMAVEWIRYITKVLITGIKGKKKVKKIEKQYILNYEKEHGNKPSGNS